MSRREKAKGERDFKKSARALAVNLARFWKEPPKGRFLNLKEILALGGASLGVSFITNIINMYVTVGQLPLIYDMGDYGSLHATIAYTSASIIGLFLTPVYGRWVQRTKTRWGRYKPYILFVAPVVAVLATLASWSPQSLSQLDATIYMYCLTVPTLLVYNLWYNTWNLFPGVFTPNRQERVDIWSPIGLVMGFAPTLMNVLKDVCAGAWGDIVAARVFGVSSAVVGILCVLALVKVKERVFVTEEESKGEKIGVARGLKLLWKNKPLLILTLALCVGCMKDTIGSIWHIIARVKYAENMADAAQIFGAVSLIIGFAATPNMILLPLMTRKMDNRNIFIMWQGINTGAYLILAIIGFDNLEQGTTSAVIITALRFCISFNAIGSLQPLMLSELGDYQQAKTGYRLDGFIQTMGYSVPLVVGQLCALVPAAIQGMVGFNPNNYIIVEGSGGLAANEMPENVLSQELIDIADRYSNIAIWISVVSGVLMIIALMFYTLSKKKHAEVVQQLKQDSVNTEEIASAEGELNIMENVRSLAGAAEEIIAEEESADGESGAEEENAGESADGASGGTDESADGKDVPEEGVNGGEDDAGVATGGKPSDGEE